MKANDYLNIHDYSYAFHATLLKNSSTILSIKSYKHIYKYFFEDNRKSHYILAQYSNEPKKMKPEFYVLINNTRLNNDINFCDMSFTVELDCNDLILNLNIHDNHDEPFVVPFINYLEHSVTGFHLLKLIEQNEVDIFFIEAIDNKLYQRCIRRIPLKDEIKKEILDCVQLYLDAKDTFDNLIENKIDYRKYLESRSIDYLNMEIYSSDIKELNVEPYLDILTSLYSNTTIANKFCERVSLSIVGSKSYTDWQRTKVRKFVEALNEKFHYWFYFLDKNKDSLLWLTLSLCGEMAGDKQEINIETFYDFFYQQKRYLREACICFNGSEEKVNEIMAGVYRYYNISCNWKRNYEKIEYERYIDF